MKASEQYFLVVLFIMLYKVALTSESVDEILFCGHETENSSSGLLYAFIHLGSLTIPLESGRLINEVFNGFE